MVVTIHLKDSLASLLQEKASARQVSPEELACDLLGDALEKLDTSEQWQTLNQRRLALIAKRSGGGLNREEAEELQRLQLAADRWFEERDNQLLEELRRFRQVVEALPDEPAPA